MNLTEQSEKEQTRIQSLAFISSIAVCTILSIIFISLNRNAGKSASILPDNKINPNTDSAVNMARLPSFGQAKANAIIEYRANGNVFKTAGDLDKVKGIGPQTVENIKPYLKFK